MVAFHNGDTTGPPGAREVEVIRTLATDVAFANVFLWRQDQLKRFTHSGVVSLT